MYLRTVKVRNKDGSVQEYVRLVESYWDKGRSKQRVVASLGRKDLLEPHLDSLVRIVRGDQRPKSLEPEAVEPKRAYCWGPMLAARRLWEELGLESILDACESRRRGKDKARLADRALVLVANRLCEPSSEHALAEWLETDFACDRQGNRFEPRWKQQGRVRVDLAWLQRWYRTLDELISHKATVERELFLRLRTLFSLEVEMVFYDITSTFFEGNGPMQIARYGYSRDGKPRNRQVLVGMVMVDGWPIAHHVFSGNVRDQKTVVDVLKDLEERFGLKRVVFVGDRGMITTDNVEEINKRGQGYLMGLRRRRNEDVFKYIERATGEWTQCPSPNNGPNNGPRTWVQEVESDHEGVRVLVARSEEREAYEQGMRERSMDRTRLALEKLASRVQTGRIKAPAKIGEAAGRILSKNHGHRYYGWELLDGKFRFFEHPVHLKREKALEGKYLIQTEEKHITPVEAVQTYKQLTDVERGFREIKDVIDLRPVYHRRKERVEAHIFVAALAFLIDRAIEKKLKSAGVLMSAGPALQALRTIHVVDIDVAGDIKRGATAGTPQAQRVLSALAIAHTDPAKLFGTTKSPAC